METESETNWRFIRTPPGPKRSGRERYAAAMYFFMAGEMDSETLEVYRICAGLDSEDPVAILQSRGIGASWIARLRTVSREASASTG